MEKKVQDFLNSGLLDKYLIGTTTASETLKVESYISAYPEVKEEYDLLQDQLELVAKAQAIQPPFGVLDNCCCLIFRLRSCFLNHLG